MSVEEALQRAIDIAGALSHAHRQNQVFGDLEPGKIIFTPSGVLLLRSEHPRLGLYAAPEQLEGKPADTRSDIFAFGAIVYELAAGEKPGSAPAPVPGPPAFDRVIRGCLAKDPDQRRQRIQTALLELRLIKTAKRARPKAIPQPLVPPVSEPEPEDLPQASVFDLIPSVPPRQPLPSAVSVEKIAAEAEPAAPAPAPAAEETAFVAPQAEVPVSTPAPHPAFFLEQPEAEAPERETEPEPRPRRVEKTLTLFRCYWQRFGKLAVGGLAVAALAVAAGAYLRWTPAKPGTVKFTIDPPESGASPGTPALSPDGGALVFSAVAADGNSLLWIRPLDSLKADPLAGTEGAIAPFWSPDSRYIAYFSGGKIKKVNAAGGFSETICNAGDIAGGGAWNRDGVILFGKGLSDGLYRVSASGGEPARLTTPNPTHHEKAHLWPRFLPDGIHYLYFVAGDSDENSGIYVGALGSSDTRRVVSSETNGVYGVNPESGKPGYLFFMRGRRILAQVFDPNQAEVKGDLFTLAEEVGFVQSLGLEPVTASDGGLMAYQRTNTTKRQLVWYDREGRRLGALGRPGNYGPARISHDAARVAVNRVVSGGETADLWILDAKSGAATQFTSGVTHEGSPAWSPDDSRLVFFSNPSGHFDLYEKLLRGGPEEPLVRTDMEKYASDWSPDGRYILYGNINPNTNSDVWVLPASGDRKPFPYLQTVSSEGYAVFSPDGKWVAYQSDESGKAEVYVERFPRPEGASAKRWQISVAGGGLPKWRRDGKELYYISAEGRLMAAAVKESETFQADPPRVLFQSLLVPKTWNLFDVTPDGERFLVNTPMDWASTSPITVVANWTADLKP